MAQKAAKEQAKRNAARLNQTLYFTICLHVFFLLLRALVFRRSFTRKSLTLYVLFSAPGLLIQFLFERNSRPTFTRTSDGTPELRRAGDDLDAKGLTEYLWDILYWTWICLGLTALFGDWAWWFYVVVPAYSGYLGYTTFIGARQGLMGAGGEGAAGAGGPTSKRQQKMEKRGGQRMVYRS